MKWSFLILLFTVTILFSNVSLAQNQKSIQINGGLLWPMSSSTGINTSMQFNYQLNSDIQIYVYSGYQSWDKFNVTILADWSQTQKQTNFSTYTSDSHQLIPIYLGGRMKLFTSKLFTIHGSVEIGYSFLSYNSYQLIKEVNSSTGAIIAYRPALDIKKKINENLLGLGAGIVLSHNLTEKLDLLISYKLNSHINSKYYDFLHSEVTNTSLNLGLSYGI